jgi:hypothetical protein
MKEINTRSYSSCHGGENAMRAATRKDCFVGREKGKNACKLGVGFVGL